MRKLILVSFLALLSGCVSTPEMAKNETSADVFVTTSTSYQNFSRGIKNGNYDIVSKALKEGVDVNKRFKSNLSPLMYVVSNQKYDLVKLFLANGANSNTIDDGTSVLNIAAYLNYTPIAAALIENGADVNVGDSEDGISPIYHAITNQNYEMAQLLINSGATVTSQFGVDEKSTQTLLNIAYDQNSITGVSFLLSSGVSVDSIIDLELQFTGLALSILNKKKEMVEVFIKHNADVNQDIMKKYKPMHLAVLGKSLPIIKMLVSEGAKCDVKDKESGKTPIEMAYGFNESIYNYLSKYCKT